MRLSLFLVFSFVLFFLFGFCASFVLLLGPGLDFFQAILANFYWFFGVFAIIFFLVLGLSIFFSGDISRSFHKIKAAFAELENGNFKARLDIMAFDEFREISSVFNNTVNAMRAMQDEREQLDKAKTEFLSITSHELRSPMTPMKAQLQMLLQGYYGKFEKEQKDALEMILRNTDRLDRILQDFLEISRIETARLKFNFSSSDWSGL